MHTTGNFLACLSLSLSTKLFLASADKQYNELAALPNSMLAALRVATLLNYSFVRLILSVASKKANR